MKGLLAVFTMVALLGAPSAQAGGLFGHSRDRHDKHCDGRAGLEPGYGSPRCRMEAPLAPGERQFVNFFGFRYVHVGTNPPRG